MHSSRYIAGLLWLLASCYDAPRTNPFDPALTPAVELLSVTVDSTSGSATLEWTPYEGKQPFAEYRVLRQRLVDVDTLAHLTDVRQTSFRDTTPEPEVEYTYWVEVVNQGEFAVGSEKHEEVVYALPSIELLRADFSSDTATAELVWTQYRGPGFTVYEVRRKVPGLDEEIVRKVSEVSDTTYTDRLLDGNTEYTYRIVVRTGWEKDVVVSSNERSGRFYPFDRSFELPDVPGTEPQAVGLVVDEQDRLYVGMTLISASRAGAGDGRVMSRGIQLHFPDQTGIGSRIFFDKIQPHLSSPLYLAAAQGRIYVCFVALDRVPWIGAVDAQGQESWSAPVKTIRDHFPAGLYLENSGDLVMADREAILYLFTEEGRFVKTLTGLGANLISFQSQFIDQVVVGAGIGPDSGDLFFILNRENRDHHVLVRLRRVSKVFDGEWNRYIGGGTGLEKGQTLNPVTMAFDLQRMRLLILESQGRLQVFDARLGIKDQYITQWGRFGIGEGEFQFPVPNSAAIAVDSQGMIYVADGGRRVQVFAP